MAERGGQTPTDGTEQTGSGMATAATGLAVDATSAGAEGGTRGAGVENPQPPLEGRGIGHVDGVARPAQDRQSQCTAEEFARIVRENLELRIRMDVQTEERARTERIELERLQLKEVWVFRLSSVLNNLAR